MAFASPYGYKTNVDVVVAFAQGDEYESNPDYVDETTTPGESRPVVDLVLTGFSTGTSRREAVPVAASAAAATKNQAFAVV